MPPVDTSLETTPPGSGFQRVRKQRTAGRTFEHVIHRSRQRPPQRVDPSLTNQRQNSRSPWNSSARVTRRQGLVIWHAQSAPAAMRDMPAEAKVRCTKKDPGLEANETCMRKPIRCDTCFVLECAIGYWNTHQDIGIIQ